jgi:iron complex transport system ATP-binding protein
VDFQANAGEVTAIIGPSGAGKSTLLKAMTGEIAYSGRIALNGLDIAAAPVGQMAQVRAVLPQATPMTFPFTVIEVVRLGLINHADRRDIANAALAKVGLAGFEGRFYQELSGGEQQRVQFARILTQGWEPLLPDGTSRWLFLDEPVSSLDIGHQLNVMQIVRGFAEQGGGVVMVMHDLNLTAMCADKVALMKAGKAVVQGELPDVFTDGYLRSAYGCKMQVNTAPRDCPFVLPQAADCF